MTGRPQYAASREAPASHGDAGASLVLPGSFVAVVFDMDGVLIDSEPLWVAAERELLARHGHAMTARDVIATHGRSIEDSIAAYAARLGIDERASLEEELLELMAAHYEAAPPVKPGVRSLVAALAGVVPLAVASNTSGRLVRIALARAGLLEAFSAVASGADLGRAKPSPDVYLEACRLLGRSPAAAVAIEDSPTGVLAARAAGMRVIGVPERDDVDLVAAGATWVLPSLGEIRVLP